MENSFNLSKQWIKTGATAGIIANLIFPLLICIPLPSFLEIFFVAVFGICFSLSGFAIHHLIKHEVQTIYTQIAALFIFVSGLLFNLMLVIQLTFKGYLNHYHSQITEPAETELLNLITKAVDPIQLAMQISNDFFIAGAMLLLAAAMYRHRFFGKIWSISAGVIAVSLIVVKCYAFPFAPQEIGIPYILGPLISLWFLAVCIQVLRLRKVFV